MILKKGSRGEDVTRLQSYLKIEADGDFGEATEKAVKEWQRANHLDSDGVVGPKTWSAMGLSTTDSRERAETSGSLIINKNYLPSGEYLKGPTKKEWIFLHHTAGWHNPYNTVDDWKKDTRGPIATEFVIGGQSITGNDVSFDGVVVQAFPSGGFGWHLGTGSNPMHTNSVGVELCNFGWLKNGKTYVGTTAASSQVVILSSAFRNYRSWHRYSDNQVESLKNLILFIANRDNIDPRKGLPELIKSKGASAFGVFDVSMCEKTKGLWLHSNVRADKFDLFPQLEMIEMLTSL